jgi:16S rRNA (cytosine1402-N4)-methyltransferase
MTKSSGVTRSGESKYHQPVMLAECIEGLRINPNGTYVDVTFGGGGHSLEILDKITEGRLIAMDQDEDAKAEADKIHHRSFTFWQANFRHVKKFLRLNEVKTVDGILADLGISSHQIDSSERGFSTRLDGPLDMRMDRKNQKSAGDILNEYPEDKLHRIFGMYGEVRNAKTLAGLVVRQRAQKKIERTGEFVELLKSIAPKGKEFKYYAQVFQALRIEVNKEMETLEEFLMQCGEVIIPGGRLVVMSYHSLEDRMVKNYIQSGNIWGRMEKDFYGNLIRPFKAVNRKPIEAGAEELASNNRARSAKLRVAERI